MDEKHNTGVEHISNINGRASPERIEGMEPALPTTPKLNARGLVLVPQPSDDPDDPLVSLGMECRSRTSNEVLELVII